MSVRGGDRGRGRRAAGSKGCGRRPAVNVGIVSKWFNRGQPVVGRYLRSAVDELGHESFVLAKPRREKGPMAGALERTGVWDQPGVTAASSFETPLAEYVDWVEHELDRRRPLRPELPVRRAGGAASAGRPDDRPVRLGALHRRAPRAGPRGLRRHLLGHRSCERERYRRLGPRDPAGALGDPPGAARGPGRARSDDGLVRFVFPGGFLGHRKPAEPVVEAFSQARGEQPAAARQGAGRALAARADAADDRGRRADRAAPRRRALARAPAAVAANDVSLSPSRWEGLGLPLYEAVAFGMPTIANDDPPMNEVVIDGVNGLLVPSHPDGTARSGIPARRPDIAALTAAIERIAAPDVLARAPRRRRALPRRPPLGADRRGARRAARRLTPVSPRGGA